MAALGCTDHVGMVDLRLGDGLAQRVFSPAGTALPNQALDRRCLPDLRIHTRSTVFAARPYFSSMAVQSTTIFGTCFILCRCGCSDYLGPPSVHQPDGHRTLSRLGCGGRAVFCQLGLCHFLCGVRLTSDVLAEFTYIYKSNCFDTIVWKIPVYD